jgi:hypothetical protein
VLQRAGEWEQARRVWAELRAADGEPILDAWLAIIGAEWKAEGAGVGGAAGAEGRVREGGRVQALQREMKAAGFTPPPLGAKDFVDGLSL